jgi:hypothetical protein
MQHFLEQWLFIERVPELSKDAESFPEGTPEVARALLAETRLFMNSVLFDAGGDGSFKTLFGASYGFVNAQTAPLYGLSAVTGEAPERRQLDPTQRRGLFTLPAFMWAHSSSDGTNLVNRGAYFRTEVLCAPVPAPPPNVVPEANFADETATGREKFAAHTQPACAGCHQLFDGIGFAMESYDAIGRYRTTDRGKPIDPSGAIPLPSRDNDPNRLLTFADYSDLLSKLSNEPDVYDCFASQYLTYATGRALSELDACERRALGTEFAEQGYGIEALILGLLGSKQFTEREP